MVDMGFRIPVMRKSDVHTYEKRGTEVYISEIDGNQTLVITTSDPRQYIEVPVSVVEKAVEDLTGQDLQAATARRAEKNGW